MIDDFVVFWTMIWYHNSILLFNQVLLSITALRCARQSLAHI